MMEWRKRIKRQLYGHVPGFAGAFPYFGTKVYFPPNSDAFYVACAQGVYERENLKLLAGLVKPDSFYFDVGANIGLMSVPILVSQPNCQVVSIEPSPNTLPFLLKTHQNSKFAMRWKIIGKAAGDEIGTAEFFVAASNHALFDGMQDTMRAGQTSSISVPVTTIDHEWKNLGSPPVSVIKLDVEGGELKALQGARECIQQSRPYILLEWNAVNIRPYKLDPDRILSFAEQIDYHLLSLPTLVPVSKPTQLALHMIKTESFMLTPN